MVECAQSGGIGRVGIRGAVAPGEKHRQHHDGNDDQQHQAERDEDQRLFLRADIAFRVHQLEMFAGGERGRRQQHRAAGAEKTENAGERAATVRSAGHRVMAHTKFCHNMPYTHTILIVCCMR
ncbi:hypothetical protein [Rhizobium sp. OAE497]|uniref:hypothetical protein n=1 Tax=Rhizobium sp. OAE497 TaxID=2663796 RepID=UPI003394D23D